MSGANGTTPEMSCPYFVVRDDGKIACTLCPRRCVRQPGERGDCGTRINRQGEWHALNLGRLSVTALDPIEKKPLFHFWPGSQTLSVAADGCNLDCPFCQNHLLSQRPREGDWRPEKNAFVPPALLLQQARRRGAHSISFTYSEPLLQLAYILEVARAKSRDELPLILVTNGQVNAQPRADLARAIAAANVDLKNFSARQYRSVLGGTLSATLDTIGELHQAGVWIEVTTLLVPDFNDTAEEVTQMAAFIAGIDRAIPWHVSAFHPDWRWQHLPRTSVQSLHRARQIGLAAGLHHVYTGNIPGDDGERTLCSGCGAVIVDRMQYRIRAIHTENGGCKRCGTRVAGTGFP
jgi:pyruvate formate lyase activating enzyme